MTRDIKANTNTKNTKQYMIAIYTNQKPLLYNNKIGKGEEGLLPKYKTSRNKNDQGTRASTETSGRYAW